MVPLRVEVLGPLRLLVDGAPVEVPGHRRRAALALLALAGGRVVSADALVDALWPDDAPDTGHRALHSHISRLRRHLGAAAPQLERAGGGYALRLDADDVDAARLRRLARRCAAELRDAAPAATATAAEALALWRGPALAEFADVPPLAAEAVGLRELYLQVRDDGLEARLAAGDGTVTADVAAAAAEEPLRERTATLLMRALAREGRAGDALAAGAAFRRRLTGETGLDPGPGVADLERRIAAGDLAAPAPASTAAPAASPPPARPSRPLARPGGPMVGRDRDAEELRRLLGGHRLVTVTGPGGVGKTRLSLDVVADLAERGTEAALVTLAEVTDGARVAGALATALRLRPGGHPTPDAVADALAERTLLLLLDNCEHVVGACRDVVAALLTRAPGVRVLATSRVTLHVPGEYVVRLQPLPLPRDAVSPAELAQQPGVRAFVEHARRRDPAFALAAADADAVVEVIRRIDGLPLAIELAAGQLAVLPPAALRDRLGRALDALSTERPAGDARHRTLRATIDWSYRLLDDGERALLRRLATFPAGADLETVEALASRALPGTDPLVALRRLVDASLVSPAVSAAANGHYTILETVRAFLLDDAAARGERDDDERAFLAWARGAALSLGRGLTGPDEVAEDRRLRAELPNLRAARDLARARGDVDLVVDVTLALDEATTFRNLEEVWRWSVELAGDPAMRGHPREAAVLGSASEAAWLAGDLPLAERLCAAAMTAADGTREPDQRRRCRYAAGAVALFQGRFDAACSHWEAAAELAPQPAQSLASAALAATYGGDRARALDLVRRAAAAEQEGPCQSHRAFVRYAEGEALAAGDPEAAIAAYTAAIDLARPAGAGFVEGIAMVGLASVWASTGDLGAAVRGYQLLLEYWNRTGSATQLWTTLRNVARLLLDHGHDAAAVTLLAAADAAASASRLTGEDAARAEREREVLDERLGPDAAAGLRALGAALTAAGASAVAREALATIPAG